MLAGPNPTPGGMLAPADWQCQCYSVVASFLGCHSCGTLHRAHPSSLVRHAPSSTTHAVHSIAHWAPLVLYTMPAHAVRDMHHVSNYPSTLEEPPYDLVHSGGNLPPRAKSNNKKNPATYYPATRLPKRLNLTYLLTGDRLVRRIERN